MSYSYENKTYCKDFSHKPNWRKLQF